MKKVLLTLMLLLPAGMSFSQPSKLLRMVDDYLIMRQQKQPFDTAYILKTQERLLVGTALNASRSTVRMFGKDDKTRFTQRFDQGNYFSQDVRVGYRGVNLTVSLGKLWVGKPFDDLLLSYGYYGNVWGFDWYYQHSGDFSGSSLVNGVKELLGGRLLDHQSMNVDAYYAFGNKKFSMPAAITQGYIQRRSAGSVILTMSCNMTSQATDPVPRHLTSYMTLYAALGCGYGYNLVIRDKWLLHSSIMPSVVLLDISKPTGESKYSFSNPVKPLDICGKGTLAAIYNTERYYLGLTLVTHGSFLGDYRNYRTNTSRALASIKLGCRF